MTELTVRYWYTVDSAAPVPAQSANCNYSHLPNSCAALAYNAPFVAVSPARTGADYYFQFGFTTMAGNLPTGVANGGKDIQFQWNKNNWSNFTQTGDYSFNNQTASWVTTTAVTVYRNGFLVYGTEP
jgi:hypothetical protein